MIVFYHKVTGKIIASFPEVYEFKHPITVNDGIDGDEMFEQRVLQPAEAKDFEDPFNPKNIHDYDVDPVTKELKLNLTAQQE